MGEKGEEAGEAGEAGEAEEGGSDLGWLSGPRPLPRANS